MCKLFSIQINTDIFSPIIYLVFVCSRNFPCTDFLEIVQDTKPNKKTCQSKHTKFATQRYATIRTLGLGKKAGITVHSSVHALALTCISSGWLVGRLFGCLMLLRRRLLSTTKEAQKSMVLYVLLLVSGSIVVVMAVCWSQHKKSIFINEIEARPLESYTYTHICRFLSIGVHFYSLTLTQTEGAERRQQILGHLICSFTWSWQVN